MISEGTAFYEGKLAALSEQRDGGAKCPHRNRAIRAAWHRGLAAGRQESTDAEHEARVRATPPEVREANKTAMADAITAWLQKS